MTESLHHKIDLSELDREAKEGGLPGISLLGNLNPTGRNKLIKSGYGDLTQLAQADILELLGLVEANKFGVTTLKRALLGLRQLQERPMTEHVQRLHSLAEPKPTKKTGNLLSKLTEPFNQQVGQNLDDNVLTAEMTNWKEDNIEIFLLSELRAAKIMRRTAKSRMVQKGQTGQSLVVRVFSNSANPWMKEFMQQSEPGERAVIHTAYTSAIHAGFYLIGEIRESTPKQREILGPIRANFLYDGVQRPKP